MPPAPPDTVYVNVESVALDLNVPAASGNKLLGVSIAILPGQFPLPPWGTACVARPWTWNADVTWTVVGLKGAAWVPIGTGFKARPFPESGDVSWVPVLNKTKTAILNAETTIASAKPGRQVGANPTAIAIDENSFGDGDPAADIAQVHKYASVLTNLASAPYPIPELLNLTFFLDLPGSDATGQPTAASSCSRFLALPTFTVPGAASQTYDGNQPVLPQQAGEPWEVSVNGVKMHAEWSAPETGNLIDSSLWLPPAFPDQTDPLVSHWQAHVYELLGPYLDVVHVLTNPAFEPGYSDRLKAILTSGPGYLAAFRDCVLAELFDLVQLSVPSPAAYDRSSWIATLATQLTGSLTPLPGALTATAPGKFADELRELRQMVGAATTGGNFIALVQRAIADYQKTQLLDKAPPVPAYLLVANKAPALLSLLQARLAKPYAAKIEQALKPPAGPPAPPVAALKTLLTAFQSLLTTVVVDNLQQKLNISFPNYPPTLVGACFPLPDPLPTQVPPTNAAAGTPGEGNASTALRADLLRLALGTVDPANLPALTGNSAPLVMPAVQARAVADPAQAPEPLRGFRGVGVLLMRSVTPAGPSGPGAPASAWTCPNVAAPVISMLDTVTNQMVDTGAPGCPALVASRLVYDRNLMTGSLLYNNGPLPCSNLLYEYMHGPDRLQHVITGATASAPAVPVDSSLIPGVTLEYASYEVEKRVPVGTAALQAGATYQFAVFAISNSGALPAGLRDGYPARFQVYAPPAATVKLSNARFLRTVPVGGLEVCDAGGNTLVNTAGLLPSVPANVWPRAADTTTFSSGQGISQPASTKAQPPLLLLTQQADKYAPAAAARQSLQFAFRLPVVDIQTWDITSGYHHNERQAILDWAYPLRARRQRAPITDPLITEVDFVLYRWTDAGWADPSGPIKYDRDALRDDKATIPSVETQPISVDVQGGTYGDATKPGKVTLSIRDAAGNPVLSPFQYPNAGGAYTLKPGEVYLLESRLYLNLTSPAGNDMMPRYAPGRALSANPAGPAATEPCIAGHQMLIEVASSDMPADLLTPLALNLQARNGLPEQQVAFRLTADTGVWRNVHRVDFLRQVWSWTGRTQPQSDPVNPGDLLLPQFFPTTQATPADAAILAAWEAIEFAERPPADYIESLSSFRLATPTVRAGFEFVLDLSLDPRATYLRVAPRIWSRYQGLFRDASALVFSTIDNATDDTRWRRTFVRSRARSLKMPRLKALLPLTESAFDTYGCPGVLAVFDGPAYDQAGLAERLTVDYATVADPDLNIKDLWAQTGPDFLTGKAPQVAGPLAQIRPKLAVTGPIGHTDDSLSGLDHKFLSHSYIIRPDEAANPGTDFSWWFAELRFQLSTDQPSSVFPKPIVSEYAIGSWIQFLPGFQNGTRADVFSDWTFTTDASTGKSRRPDSVAGGGQTIKLFHGNELQAPGVSPHLTPFLLVERLALDIAGVEKPDYFGIAVMSNDGKGYVMLDGSDWNSAAKLQVRVLLTRQDVAVPGPFDNHADFWETIIGPASANVDDRRRMMPVNLSAPIRQGASS